MDNTSERVLFSIFFLFLFCKRLRQLSLIAILYRIVYFKCNLTCIYFRNVNIYVYYHYHRFLETYFFVLYWECIFYTKFMNFYATTQRVLTSFISAEARSHHFPHSAPRRFERIRNMNRFRSGFIFSSFFARCRVNLHAFFAVRRECK